MFDVWWKLIWFSLCWQWFYMILYVLHEISLYCERKHDHVLIGCEFGHNQLIMWHIKEVLRKSINPNVGVLNHIGRVADIWSCWNGRQEKVIITNKENAIVEAKNFEKKRADYVCFDWKFVSPLAPCAPPELTKYFTANTLVVLEEIANYLTKSERTHHE